jgi:predicted aspartyl protease
MMSQISAYIKNSISSISITLPLILIVYFNCNSAYCQTQSYDQAMSEYKAHRYSRAALLFNNYISSQLNVHLPLSAQLPEVKDKPLFVYSIFYEAVCLEQIGNFDDAAIIYRLLDERYPGTPIGSESKKALGRSQITKALHQKFPDTARSTDLDFLPKQTWIPFKRFGNLMLVEGSINGHQTGMLFDTGAAGCLFSNEHLKTLGIALPAGKPTTSVTGIGTQKQTPAWSVNVDLKLGNISRRRFPVQVNDNPLNYPLLGTNFFEGMEYTIDNDSNIIQFKTLSNNVQIPINKFTITVDASSHYVYNVPFNEVARAIVVTAKIAGKDCQMMLDTGTDLCLFTNSQLKNFGIMPRPTGKYMNCKGAAGFMKAPLCVFDKAEFGPIKGPLVCLVTDQANLPLPLLGQNFLKEWQLTVDHSSHLIKLIRK